MDVLQLDISGRPQAWISSKEAAVIYASDGVAWTLGDAFRVLRGGYQRTTGKQSRIEVHPIVAVREIGQHVGVATPSVDALLGLVRLMAKTRGLMTAA